MNVVVVVWAIEWVETEWEGVAFVLLTDSSPPPRLGKQTNNKRKCTGPASNSPRCEVVGNYTKNHKMGYQKEWMSGVECKRGENVDTVAERGGAEKEGQEKIPCILWCSFKDDLGSRY